MTERFRGRDLRIERVRAGLSQAQMASLLGVHKSVISNIETETAGEYPSPEFVERYVVACENAANGTAA
jgi:transcriptional regulator with XRE-family HTH domain